MPSVVDLCNQALGRLGQEPIVSLDDTLNGQRCGRLWPTVRDEVLESDEWRCTMKRANIAAKSAAPSSTFLYEYVMPADFIKLVAIKSSSDWSMEGKSILTNQEGPLSILYVYQAKDPSVYTATLYSAMAWRMAVELSGYVTTSTVRKDETYQMYLSTLGAAMNSNMSQTPPAKLSEDGWIMARRTTDDDFDYFG